MEQALVSHTKTTARQFVLKSREMIHFWDEGDYKELEEADTFAALVPVATPHGSFSFP